MRQSANDPQIQLAEDAARMLETSPKAFTAVPKDGNFDITESIAPFVVIYDDEGRPLSGDGLLNGSLPTLPQGVFDYARIHGEDRVTWQPEPGVRNAIVVARVEGARPGFVMAGRSLRDTEARAERLSLATAAAALIGLIGTFVLVFIAELA